MFVIVESFVLWNATNRDMFTRYHDPERAERDSNDQGLTDLFGDGNSADDVGASAIPPVPNQFRLGLLPSTYPWQLTDKHLVSLLTLAGPAALIAMLTLGAHLHDRRKRTPPPETT